MSERKEDDTSSERGREDLDTLEKQMQTLENLEPRGDASSLTNTELTKELENREIQPSGFWAQDVKSLQHAFDTEYEEKSAHLESKKAEIAKRRESALDSIRQKQRTIREMEEERTSLGNSIDAQFMIKILRDGRVDSSTSIKLVVDPPLARVLSTYLEMDFLITTLDLSQSNIGDDAGERLGQALYQNSSVKKLELEHCQLGPKSAASLGRMLRENKLIKYISLEGNPLTGDQLNYVGFQAFVSGLAHNDTVEHCNLWNTGLGTEGGRILVKGLQIQSEVLTSLMIGGNDISLLEEKALARIMKVNRSAKEEVSGLRERHELDEKRFLMTKQKEQDKVDDAREEEEWLERRKIERAEERRQKKEEDLKKKQEEEERKRKEEEERQRRIEAEKTRLASKKKKKKKKK